MYCSSSFFCLICSSLSASRAEEALSTITARMRFLAPRSKSCDFPES